MEIQIWHEDHDLIKSINFIPQIGSIIHLSDDSFFVKESGFNGFEVIRVCYWVYDEDKSDECAVIVKNAIDK